MYAALEKSDNGTESIAFASAMEEEVTEDPFIKQHVAAGNDSDFEPLHAVDAARRLLDNNDTPDVQPSYAPVEATDPAPFAMMGAMGGVSKPESLTPVLGGIDATATTTTSNVQMTGNSSQMRNSSLLERIQQQKKHQPSAPTSATTMNAPTTTTTMTHNYAPSSTGIFPEGNYSYASGPTSTPASTTTTSNTLNIPQYSSAPRPNPYDSSSDYKDKMMNVLSVAGSVANTAAKSAVSGTKYLYNNLIHKTATSGGRQSTLGGGGVGGGRMGEMDYQRESLLMDPHDLENSAAAFSSSTNPNQEQFQQQEQQQRPPGMRSMSGSVSFEQQQQQPLEASGTNAILVSLKQFMVDMKDLFLAAPRSAQITVIGVFVLILWLLFSEV